MLSASSCNDPCSSIDDEHAAAAQLPALPNSIAPSTPLNRPFQGAPPAMAPHPKRLASCCDSTTASNAMTPLGLSALKKPAAACRARESETRLTTRYLPWDHRPVSCA
uniref:Uncharacterized protein n=1 Tax=Arundo donax TaxID=35708 RepID=A0A0A8XU06_ARUDO